MVCVFDIETIPDFHLLSECFGYTGSPQEISESAFVAQKEKSGSEFLPPCFHRVVSISSVACDEFGHFKRVGHFGRAFFEEHFGLDSENSESSLSESAPDFTSREFLDSLEEALLSEFFAYLNKRTPRLVSYNGRGFDLPVLCLRALRYNINAHGYFEQHNPQLNKDKWNNYRQRFAEHFHTDLLDCLSGFGAVRGLSLDHLCKMLDIVGKYDLSGDQVFETYLSGLGSKEAMRAAFETINNYCHSDVLNTYWLFLRYEMTKGVILESDYAQILKNWSEDLPQDKPYTEAFTNCLKRHITRYS